jgi:hypothetical protein
MNFKDLIKTIAVQLMYMARGENMTIRMTARPDGTIDIMCHRGEQRIYDLSRRDDGQWEEMDHENYQLRKFN